jgi:hypothetical protein
MVDRRRNLDIFRGFPIWLPGIIQDSIVYTRDHSDPKCVGKLASQRRYRIRGFVSAGRPERS